MKKRMVSFILTLLFVIMGLTSCTTRQGAFTILSSKNVEISRVDLKRIDFRRNVEGSDGRFWLLFIPFGGAPNLEDSVDQCLENGNGDFMTSAVVYTNQWSLILFSWESWYVKGDVGNSLSEGAADLKDRRTDFD